MANKKFGTLYIGSTSDITRRSREHKTGTYDGFTKRHDIKILVYFETFSSLEEARIQEWRIKRWKREWKINRIERMNPTWQDITPEYGT